MKIRKMAVTLAVTATLSAQVNATGMHLNLSQQIVPESGFSQSLFNNSNEPMQLAELSQQEMKDTEGAFWWMALYYAPAISAAAWSAVNSAAYLPVYHLGTALGNAIDAGSYNAGRYYREFIEANEFK